MSNNTNEEKKQNSINWGEITAIIGVVLTAYGINFAGKQYFEVMTISLQEKYSQKNELEESYKLYSKGYKDLQLSASDLDIKIRNAEKEYQNLIEAIKKKKMAGENIEEETKFLNEKKEELENLIKIKNLEVDTVTDTISLNKLFVNNSPKSNLREKLDSIEDVFLTIENRCKK